MVWTWEQWVPGVMMILNLDKIWGITLATWVTWSTKPDYTCCSCRLQCASFMLVRISDRIRMWKLVTEKSFIWVEEHEFTRLCTDRIWARFLQPKSYSSIWHVSTDENARNCYGNATSIRAFYRTTLSRLVRAAALAPTSTAKCTNVWAAIRSRRWFRRTKLNVCVCKYLHDCTDYVVENALTKRVKSGSPCFHSLTTVL